MMTTREPIGMPAEYYREHRRQDENAERDARIAALEERLRT